MLSPQQIEGLLTPLPICYDIQRKILMMCIGANGTPSSKVIRKLCDHVIFHRSQTRFDYFTYKEKTLTSFCIDLTLFNYMKHVYEEEECTCEGDMSCYGKGKCSSFNMPEDFLFNEFVYEFCIAYEHYQIDDSTQEYLSRRHEELKRVVKRRLQKMIQDEPKDLCEEKEQKDNKESKE